VVDGEEAVVHRGEDGLRAPAVAGDLREAALQLVGGLVDDAMMRASSPSSSSRRTRMRAERLPDAKCRAVSIIPSSERASEAESSTERRAVARRPNRRATAPDHHSSRACASIPPIPRERRATPTTRPALRTGTAA
jgi:hypothetical protein